MQGNAKLMRKRKYELKQPETVGTLVTFAVDEDMQVDIVTW